MENQIANEIRDQIKVWKRERDQLEDLIEEAYKRIDQLEEQMA